MSNSAMDGMPRHQRRALLDAEARARKSGKWGAWVSIPLPNGLLRGSSWTKGFRDVRKNTVFSVLLRPLPNGEMHLMVSSLSGIRPTFHEMQRIKNEIAGEDATAVEVYPP